MRIYGWLFLLFQKGDFMFSFDLKSGYHHVDIADIHTKYLGFSWAGKYYVFTVFPFGLASACYIFTKLLRPLTQYWRSKGLRILIYLDDGICAVTGCQAAQEASRPHCSKHDLLLTQQSLFGSLYSA